MKKKVLVTGGNGFVGRWVLKDLCLSHDVLALVRGTATVPDGVSKISFSGALSGLDCRVALAGCSSVIHLAGAAHRKINNQAQCDAIRDVNIDATINLAKQAELSGVKRFIFLSSIGVIGDSSELVGLDESAIPHPLSPYAQSKYEAEQKLLSAAEHWAMEIVILRPPLVYGPSAPGNFGRWVRLVERFPVNVFASVNNKRSLVSVRNLADLILHLVEVPLKSKTSIYHVADMTVSTYQLWDLTAKVLSRKTISFPLANRVFMLLGKVPMLRKQLSQLTGNMVVNGNKVIDDLEWKPRFDYFSTFK